MMSMIFDFFKKKKIREVVKTKVFVQFKKKKS